MGMNVVVAAHRRRRSRVVGFTVMSCVLAVAALAASCTSPGDGGSEHDADVDGLADVARPDVGADGPGDAPADAPADVAHDVAHDATADGGLDASEDADASDDADDADAGDAADGAVSDPLCSVAANAFEPGAVCGVSLSVDVACTHTVTQQAMSGGCCVPKNPGVACVPSPFQPDTSCCVGAGTYCGLVSETTESIPITLVLRRGARSGFSACPYGATTTLSTTKVSVQAPPTPAGITLALGLFERPRCVGGSYEASFTRTDTTSTYAGTWQDHPSISQNRDSSGDANVTMNGDGTISYTANGTVLLDTGAFTPTWIRRTNVGHCAVTFTP